MASDKNTRQNSNLANQPNTMGTIGAAAGALIGAAIGVWLADEKRRRKVTETLIELKDQAIDTLIEVDEKSEDEEKLIEGGKKRTQKASLN